MLRAAARGKSPSWATTGLKKQIWLKEALQEPEFQACVNEIPVEVSRSVIINGISGDMVCSVVTGVRRDCQQDCRYPGVDELED